MTKFKKRDVADILGWQKGTQPIGKPKRLEAGGMVDDPRPHTYWVRKDGCVFGWAWLLDSMTKKQLGDALRYMNGHLDQWHWDGTPKRYDYPTIKD